MGVVTISAAFGAGGSEIGPAVAERLGLRFVDRAIPAAVARELGVPLDQAQEHDETVDTGFARLLSTLALVPDLAGAGPLTYSTVTDEETFRERTESVLQEVARGEGGVVLGRGAAFVLAKEPQALHVRLGGPASGRLARLIERHPDTHPEELRKRIESNDRARAAYIRHFYKADPGDVRHYHLAIDTSTLSWDAATDVIVVAARSRGIGAAG
jgi:cytidylate kinase